MDSNILIRRVTVWIDVIAESNEIAGTWVTAQLNGLSDMNLSPIDDFDVTNVEPID